MSYKSIGFAKFCPLLSTRHLIVLLDFLMETILGIGSILILIP